LSREEKIEKDEIEKAASGVCHLFSNAASGLAKNPLR